MKPKWATEDEKIFFENVKDILGEISKSLGFLSTTNFLNLDLPNLIYRVERQRDKLNDLVLALNRWREGKHDEAFQILGGIYL